MALTREIPLLARLAQTEPELVTAAGAASHSSLVLGSAARVAATLRRAGATMPDAELTTVAELMLRVSWTFLLNPQGTLDVGDDEAGAGLRAALPRPARQLRRRQRPRSQWRLFRTAESRCP